MHSKMPGNRGRVERRDAQGRDDRDWPPPVLEVPCAGPAASAGTMSISACPAAQLRQGALALLERAAQHVEIEPLEARPDRRRAAPRDRCRGWRRVSAWQAPRIICGHSRSTRIRRVGKGAPPSRAPCPRASRYAPKAPSFRGRVSQHGDPRLSSIVLRRLQDAWARQREGACP